MTHVRTRLFYPQSNGKIERWHQVLKSGCIRPKTPLSLDNARELVREFVDYYNHERLHCAIGYIAPIDKIEGRESLIFEDRDRKLALARERRRKRRLSTRHCSNILEPEVDRSHPLAVGLLSKKHG